MHFARKRCLLAGLLAALCSGPMPSAGQAQNPGVPPEWEIRADLKTLVEHTGELEAALLEVHPELWSEDSPRQSYQEQLKSIRDETGYAQRSAQGLSARPERLTLALETYLRLQSVGEMLNSLNDGVRRYQSESAADRLRSVWSEGAAGRDKLREYMMRLAEEMESQYKVMTEEAQRCRELLMRQPRPDPPKKTVTK